MKTTLLMAGIATALMVNTAEAQGQTGRGPDLPGFEQIDADNDGLVTTAELQAAIQAQAAERFAQSDTDGDGALSAEELAAAAAAREDARRERNMTRMIERLDANDDGLLQMDEMQARSEDRNTDRQGRMFAMMDTDDDGSLSAQEYETALAFMAERGERGDRGGRGDRGDRGGRHGN